MRRSCIVVLVILSILASAVIVFPILTTTGVIAPSSSFAAYPFLDVAGYLSTIIIGFFFTYIISISSQKESKKLMVLEETFNYVKEDLSHLMNYLYKIKGDSLTNNSRNYILALSYIVDKDFAILSNFANELPKLGANFGDLKKARSNFTYTLTEPLAVGFVVSEDYINDCIEKYYNVKQAILKCKTNLYI